MEATRADVRRYLAGEVDAVLQPAIVKLANERPRTRQGIRATLAKSFSPPRRKIVHFVRHGHSVGNQAMDDACRKHGTTMHDFQHQRMREMMDHAAGISSMPTEDTGGDVIEEEMLASYSQSVQDSPLTEKGEGEARERLVLARKKSQFEGVQLVVSSPLSRTLKTACIVFEDVLKDASIPALTNECVREIIVDVPPEIPRHPEELKKEFPRFDIQDVDSSFSWGDSGTWKSADDAWRKSNPEAEHMKDMLKGNFDPSPLVNRAREALHWLLRLPQTEMAVVTHAGIFMLGFTFFIRKELDKMTAEEQAAAGVSRFNTPMNNCELRTCELWSDGDGTVRLKPVLADDLYDASGERRSQRRVSFS